MTVMQQAGAFADARPCFGEHSEYVCLEFLGMSEAEYDELLIENVFN